MIVRGEVSALMKKNVEIDRKRAEK